MANQLRFRSDHVGLLIAPPDGGEGDALRRKLIAMQRAANCSVATDGELFRSHFIEAIQTADAPILAEAEGKPMVALANMDVKVSLPSASALMERTGMTEGAAVGAIRREVAALIEAGVPYIQLNGTAYGPLLDEGRDIDAQLAADRAVVDGLASGEEHRLALRIGRQGASPEWNADDARLKALFGLGYDRYLLDFGTQPRGFEVLALIPDPAMVVLGLIDQSVAELQPIDPILDLIDAAAEVIDGDRLALSPRGGFSAKSGLSWADQDRKLAQVADVCVRWWGFAR